MSQPELSILLVNYNSSDFIIQNLKSIYYLTKSSHKIFICDNGSSALDLISLRNEAQFHPNLEIIIRSQSTFGSMGHGEALNILHQKADTRYTAILDADCIPLTYGWDQILIDKINKKTKIAGTPITPDTLNVNKPMDFPLMFLCVFETETFNKLDVDFRPGDISAGQDTGWQLREKYLAAGYKGYSLFGCSTRYNNIAEFKENICDVYFTDDTKNKIFCSHLGRGSNPKTTKYSRNFTRTHIHRRDKQRWLINCNKLINKTIQTSDYIKVKHWVKVNCPICNGGEFTTLFQAQDIINQLEGYWNIQKCNMCTMVITNPRPDISLMPKYYPATLSYYSRNTATQPPGQSPVARFKKFIYQQTLRQHFNYHRELGKNIFFKWLTRPLKFNRDIELIPVFPEKAKSTPLLLEIGCSYGGRLLDLKELGWKIMGVEFSDFAGKKAREAGLDVEIKSIENIDYPENKFDCIILSMVLEHLDKPAEIIKKIERWLKPDGQLLISVPDFNGIESKMFGKYHYGLQPPTHFNHFTSATIKRLLTNFKVQITHQHFHRDFYEGAQFSFNYTNKPFFKYISHIPRKALKPMLILFALIHKTSRMSIRAIHKT